MSLTIEKQKSRQINFDILRILATLAVITLHIDSKLWYTQLGVDNSKWILANLMDGLSRWSVPVFFMLSGYFVLNKPKELPNFYKKRLTRIVYPLLFWSLIFILFNTFFLNKDLSVDIFFTTIFDKKASFHLWFVYSLIGLYLIAPFIQSSLQKKPVYGYYFILIGVLILIFKFLITYLFGYKLGIDTQYFHYPLIYFVLGYQTRKIDFSKIKYIKLISGIVFLISTLLAIYLVQKYSIASDKNKPYNIFYAYSHPFIILSSLSIFIFFLNLKISISKNIMLSKLILSLSKYSYGIYLCHILIRSCINKGYFGKFLIISYLNTNPLYYICYNVLLIFIVSYFIILILDKLTFGRVTKLIT